MVVERQDEELIYQAILETDEEYSSAQVDEIMKSHRFIRSIERCDDNWFNNIVVDLVGCEGIKLL